MEKLIHLKNDLGINKSAIWKSYEEDGSHLPENEHTERGFDKLKELLDRRTQKYTKEECKILLGGYLTSHDYCVTDNYDEFSLLQVYQANQKYDRHEKALNKLKQF